MSSFLTAMMALLAAALPKGGNEVNMPPSFAHKQNDIAAIASSYNNRFNEHRNSGTSGISGVSGVSGISGVSGTTGEEGPIGATGEQGPKGPTGATGATGPDTSRWPAINLRSGKLMPTFIPRVAIENSQALDFLNGTPYPTIPGQRNRGVNGNGNAFGHTK